MAVVGYLAGAHILVAWRQKRNRLSGCLALAWLGGLALTGWMLYYADDGLRDFALLAHWWLGLGLPAVVVVHVIIGLASRRGSRPAAPRVP